MPIDISIWYLLNKIKKYEDSSTDESSYSGISLVQGICTRDYAFFIYIKLNYSKINSGFIGTPFNVTENAK